MDDIQKYDFVRVIVEGKYNGAEGIVTDVKADEIYPYTILFIGKYHNELSYKLGGLLWRAKELKAI